MTIIKGGKKSKSKRNSLLKLTLLDKLKNQQKTTETPLTPLSSQNDNLKELIQLQKEDTELKSIKEPILTSSQPWFQGQPKSKPSTNSSIPSPQPWFQRTSKPESWI